MARPDSTYPIVIKPYKLDLTQFGEKVRDEIKFTLNNLSQSDVHPKLIDFPAHLLEVKLPRVIPAGKTAEGVVTLKSAALEKAFDKSITLELDDEKASRFTIPIKRQVRTTATAAVPAASGTPVTSGSGH